MQDTGGQQTSRRTEDPRETIVAALEDRGQVFPWRGALPSGYAPMPTGLCFDNARQLIQAHPALRYAEGYGAGTPGITRHHAWAVGPDGWVIDPTWDGMDLGRRTYTGVLFTAEEFEDRWLRIVAWTADVYGVACSLPLLVS